MAGVLRALQHELGTIGTEGGRHADKRLVQHVAHSAAFPLPDFREVSLPDLEVDLASLGLVADSAAGLDSAGALGVEGRALRGLRLAGALAVLAVVGDVETRLPLKISAAPPEIWRTAGRPQVGHLTRGVSDILCVFSKLWPSGH